MHLLEPKGYRGWCDRVRGSETNVAAAAYRIHTGTSTVCGHSLRLGTIYDSTNIHFIGLLEMDRRLIYPVVERTWWSWDGVLVHTMLVDVGIIEGPFPVKGSDEQWKELEG